MTATVPAHEFPLNGYACAYCGRPGKEYIPGPSGYTVHPDGWRCPPVANTLPVAQIVAELRRSIKRDWLLFDPSGRLHWADLDGATLVKLHEHGRLASVETLACGKTARGIYMATSARVLSRCVGCCKATGVPEGVGGPGHASVRPEAAA